MDWITGLSRAIDYIEENLTYDIDYSQAAKRAYSSSYHFQRVFSILCGYTLGEYIRKRRLTLAGNDLKNADNKVIDVALKYGYENPDSFSRAFTNFHGVNPSAARENGSVLKSFSRLHLKLSLEGGNTMNYRIEEKEAQIYTGYARHFDGAPGNRWEQEREFFCNTRANQYLLQGMAQDCTAIYNIITNIDDSGYDFYIAALLPCYMREHIEDNSVLGKEDAKRFEMIEIPKTAYAVFETEKAKYPTMLHMELHRQIITEWLPSSGYELAGGAEITLTHWYKNPRSEERFIELWLPVIKK
ncbi:MAG: AraC family transcriptional regulator [Clostridiales bacterium]|jgi:AraC family transcriptional regulator|nr:AraC family transcriptional regulator [Clostridiales bacterium]